MIQMIKPLKLRYIRDNINNKVIEVKDQDMQRLKSLEHLIKKLELNK